MSNWWVAEGSEVADRIRIAVDEWEDRGFDSNLKRGRRGGGKHQVEM